MRFHKNNKLTFILLSWLMLFTLQASAQTDSVGKVEINKRPLQDFAVSVFDKWENKEIDLTKSFSVELEGTLTKDGKIDFSKSSFTKSEGDEDIVKVAKDAIEAIGDSGWFMYLRNMGIKDFTLVISQNENAFSGKIVSKMKSEMEAKSVASGYNGLISLAKFQKLGADEKMIINSMKIPRSDDSQMILEFVMPKAQFQEMINRKLKEASENRSKQS